MAQVKELEPSREASWFEEQVMDLLPDLLSGARAMAGTSADAEDLVAESVARAWERRRDLEDRERFRGWLFRIMRNCFLSGCRKRRVRPRELPLPEEGEDDPSFSLFERVHQPFLLWWGDPEKDFLNGLLKEDLERAVGVLPAYYRTVVVMADVRGFSYAEIAEALDVPVGTVRSRLARARARLQENLWSHAVDRGLREPEPDERGSNERPA